MTVEHAIASRLIQWRRTNHRSQAQVAVILDCSAALVYKLETGARREWDRASNTDLMTRIATRLFHMEFMEFLAYCDELRTGSPHAPTPPPAA
jgi:hypothetical protein